MKTNVELPEYVEKIPYYLQDEEGNIDSKWEEFVENINKYYLSWFGVEKSSTKQELFGKFRDTANDLDLYVIESIIPRIIKHISNKYLFEFANDETFQVEDAHLKSELEGILSSLYINSYKVCNERFIKFYENYLHAQYEKYNIEPVPYNEFDIDSRIRIISDLWIYNIVKNIS